MESVKNSNLSIMLAVVMFAVTGGSLAGPILPEMMNLPAATSRNVGWVLSVYTLFAMVTTPLLGPVADRFGRKRVIVPCVMLFGVAGLMITFSRSLGGVLVWRAFQGIAVGGMMNTVIAAIGDMYQEPERSQAMGYRITAQSVTNSAVPFISGAIATFAWFLPFYIHSTAILLAIFAAFKLKEPARSSRSPHYVARALRAIMNIRAVWLFFSNFCGFLLLYGIIVYMPILLVEQFGLSTFHSGLAISAASVVTALVASQAGRIKENVSDELRVLVGFAFGTISYILLAIAGSYVFVLSCMGIWGIGFGLLMPTLNAAAAGLVSNELRAGVLSVFTLLVYLGQSVAPPFFALFVQDTMVTRVFIAGSIVSVIPLVFAIYMCTVQHSQK